MNNARIAEAERGLNGTMRKVLDAVPIEEAWTVTEIIAEMARSGFRYEAKMVLGCLDNLRAHGLVREPSAKTFQRIGPKQPLVVVPVAKSKKATNPEPEPDPQAEPKPQEELGTTILQANAPDVLVRIADLASELREIANQLDDAALEVTAKLQKIEADSAKMRQLQTLLRALSDEATK